MTTHSMRREEPRKELETLGVLALACLLMFAKTHRQGWIFAAAALLFISLFVKPLAKSLNALWLKLSEVLGWLNGRILLSIVFFGILSPIAWLYRLTHRDVLMLRRRTGQDRTYWTSRGHEYGPKDFETLW